MHWPDMTGWGPEALGALIGATAAGLIAIGLNRAESRRQGRSEVRTAARNAFAEVCVALADLPDAIAGGIAFEQQSHNEIVRKMIAWSVHLEATDLQLEKDMRDVLVKVLKVAYRLAIEPIPPGEGYKQTVMFRDPGSESCRLMDGLLDYGKAWHVAASKKERRTAAQWFRENAA